MNAPLSNKPRRVVIAGGGTAGWMAAAAMSKLIKDIDVVLVESDAIGTIGVGEATIPTLLYFHQLLGINEAEFLQATQGTFKLGIQFENWRDKNQHYIHAFGVTGQDCWAAGFQHFWVKGQQLGIANDFGDYCLEQVAACHNKFAHLPNNGLNYAYHIDATRYAAYLRSLSEAHGAKRIEGKITRVNLDPKTHFIQNLVLDNGQCIEGDVFIDCTGQRALLIEQTLHAGFEDWSHWLPQDSAIAVQTHSTEAPKPYTRSIAHESGWQWRIPLQHRMGNGIVYSSRYESDASAEERLLNSIQGDTITSPRKIKFQTGTRRKHWHKNCVALGLASGFLEPLESTSIHLIQQGIVRFLRLFPANGILQADIDEFNQQTRDDIASIRDFIILHYAVTERRDSDFWRHCTSMELPDSLAHRIALFAQTGRVFRKNNELFDDSWMQVMIGQGLIPAAYHPIVDNMSEDELDRFLTQIKHTEADKVARLPSHAQYLDYMANQVKRAG
ncbi:tryptophan 7-halogenase [Aestuariibacter sp. AA17]|uniref:Tryptophan 7-halogenase n=1 Tax=Fluctibacter corallii TaxID=2984329 RepID=A0ABT3A758_9ALTE|nr:tryptophan halogenase family protein [Aestuariibacter sp. AA17]MCV2884519.1 tryptophan 7-halogenase [Aestuariibacter sp. AA17]